MRNETNFKLGDNVFDIRRGWGCVIGVGSTNVNLYPVIVRFLNEEQREHSYTFDGRDFIGSVQSLSFTEYTFNGFSQERPEVLPEVGDVVWVRGEFPSQWVIGHFLKKEGNTYYVSDSPYTTEYVAGGIEMTTENPHKK
jgi:hypothetical protein